METPYLVRNDERGHRIRVVRRADGDLHPLEPMNVPTGKILVMRVEETMDAGPRPPGVLPVRDLGPMKTSLTRDDIYGGRF
jgi:hypothetical protein